MKTLRLALIFQPSTLHLPPYTQHPGAAMQRFTAACAQFAIIPMDAHGEHRQGRRFDNAAPWMNPVCSSSCCRKRCLRGWSRTSLGTGYGTLMGVLPGRFSEPLQRVA